MTPTRVLTYPFPLRCGDTAFIKLPVTFTAEDAERLAKVLPTLVVAPPEAAA